MTTSARETIMAGLMDELWKIEGVTLVDRNLRRMAALSQFPAIFVVDLGDEVVRRVRARPPEYERKWTLGVASIVQGTTEDSAASELDTHQVLVKIAMYAAGDAIRVGINELLTEQVTYPDLGNNVVAQGIQFEVVYVDRVDSD